MISIGLKGDRQLSSVSYTFEYVLDPYVVGKITIVNGLISYSSTRFLCCCILILSAPYQNFDSPPYHISSVINFIKICKRFGISSQLENELSKFFKNSVDNFHKVKYTMKKTSEVISMKEKSYTELMKSSAMNRKKAKESFVLDLYVEMLLSESLLKAEKEKLSKRIDQAIDEKNKPEFFKLSKEYKLLTKRFGT
jgi:hypothetical protein